MNKISSNDIEIALKTQLLQKLNQQKNRLNFMKRRKVEHFSSLTYSYKKIKSICQLRYLICHDCNFLIKNRDDTNFCT